MLFNTFLHLPGIGRHKERRLWEAGIRTWDDYENAFPVQETLFSPVDNGLNEATITASRRALADGDMDYFARLLPGKEHFRIALTVPNETVFLDIETTGLSRYYHEITLIGASIGDGYICYVKGSNKKKILEYLSESKCLVTFNGTAFDLKFIRKEFPKARLPMAHIDLRFFARSVGLRGGQKAIEDELHVQRPGSVDNITGEAAPLLWHKYRLGDPKAGRDLVTYNHADVEGMKIILDETLRRAASKYHGLDHLLTEQKFSIRPSRLSFASTRDRVTKNRVYLPKARGRIRPKTTYRNLAEDPRVNNLRVVGIDLTGSEARATGWCLIDGNTAHTRLLNTNAELIVETQIVRPDLVSIDSPLSLPKGRMQVGDDDPGRKEYGILRECEHELMRRGVSVYPCLIPSMQAMTARGIRLATHFRRLGIPVIESYPGAAQDIMGIPRKRAGLDHLKKGLENFGIKGNFLTTDVSHDEVDAVTSAIVGLFFWSGKFEALGNEDEDYLIIPDLKVSPVDWRQRKVIGVSGPIAAGKTTAATHLRDRREYAYGRYSMVLAQLLKKDGKRASRNALQEFGEQVHKSPGQRWLSQQIVKQLPNTGDLVIDGLRFPEDHAYLVERFGPAFKHVHIEASWADRETRYIQMGRSAVNFRRAISHAVETQIQLMQGLAETLVHNDISKKGFKRRIDRVIIAQGIQRGGS